MRPDADGGFQPASLASGLAQTGFACIAAAADMWQRSCEIGVRYVERAVGRLHQADGTAGGPQHLLQQLAGGYRHYLTEMLLVPSLAVARFRRGLEPTPGPRLLFCTNPKLAHQLRQGICPQDLRQAFGRHGIELREPVVVDTTPATCVIRDAYSRCYFARDELGELAIYGEQEGRLYRVSSRTVLLPDRIHDAAQGFAMYAVAKEPVQELLNELPGRPFHALELNPGRTALALFMVDYRESDLGHYRELGIGFLVAPPKDPLAFGLYTWALPVTDQFSCDAGRMVWGYPKTLQSLAFAYETHSVKCVLHRQQHEPPVFSLTLPRGGSGSTTDIPIYSYTVREGIPYRSIFVRSGRDERIRSSGQGVKLVLGEESHNATDPIWRLLHRLGVGDAAPIMSSWTEHMSGSCGEPVRLDARRP
jgi:Acetoacetate decarboxylase (ADC)